MRINIYAARGSRGVWEEARRAARIARVSLSDFVASALREKLDRDTRRALKARRPS